MIEFLTVKAKDLQVGDVVCHITLIKEDLKFCEIIDIIKEKPHLKIKLISKSSKEIQVVLINYDKEKDIIRQKRIKANFSGKELAISDPTKLNVGDMINILISDATSITRFKGKIQEATK